MLDICPDDLARRLCGRQHVFLGVPKCIMLLQTRPSLCHSSHVFVQRCLRSRCRNLSAHQHPAQPEPFLATRTAVSQLDISLQEHSDLLKLGFPVLRNMATLLAEAFYRTDDDSSPLRPLLATLYGIRVLCIILVTFAVCGTDSAGCILATRRAEEDEPQELEHDATAAAQQQHEVHRRHKSAAWLPTQDPGTHKHIVGMVTVHMINVYGKMAQDLKQPPGSSCALVANMAVRADMRGRGVARSMLYACESLVRRRFKQPPKAFLLLVYRDNLPAVALYESAGFKECQEWVDPAWLEDAEKGRMGCSRRLLFVKDFHEPSQQ